MSITDMVPPACPCSKVQNCVKQWLRSLSAFRSRSCISSSLCAMRPPPLDLDLHRVIRQRSAAARARMVVEAQDGLLGWDGAHIEPPRYLLSVVEHHPACSAVDLLAHV